MPPIPRPDRCWCGFVFALNQFNRTFVDDREYDSDIHTFARNLRTEPVYDKDPFSGGGALSALTRR
jgi:hypothetical protein